MERRACLVSVRLEFRSFNEYNRLRLARHTAARPRPRYTEIWRTYQRDPTRSYAEIGRQLGLSTERVRQVVWTIRCRERIGLPPPS